MRQIKGGQSDSLQSARSGPRGRNLPKRIVIIQGHPDKSPERFCRALASAYERGAREAGHDVRRIDVATLDFELLRTQEE